MSTIGSRIKNIRQKLNMSQEEFADLFDAGKSYISAVEHDKSKLSVDSLVKLLMNYNVNINYLLGGLGSPFNKAKLDDDFTQKVEEILKQRGLI